MEILETPGIFFTPRETPGKNNSKHYIILSSNANLWVACLKEKLSENSCFFLQNVVPTLL